jgi:hypothetical protein
MKKPCPARPEERRSQGDQEGGEEIGEIGGFNGKVTWSKTSRGFKPKNSLISSPPS